MDGILSYYYLFVSRFIQNDYPTNISIFYSFLFMTYIGTYFGMGTGKILITIVFSIVGLMLGLSRKIIPLSLVFVCIYIGSLFSKGNGRIFPIILFFIIGLYLSKYFSKKYSKSYKSKLLKFFI